MAALGGVALLEEYFEYILGFEPKPPVAKTILRPVR